MRFLLLFFLLGVALAKPVHDAPEFEQIKILASLEHNPTLNELLALAEADEGTDDDGPQTELGKKLQEHLDEVLEKIKDAIEKGKTIREDLVEKAKEIREKLKELKIDVGNKAKELYQKIKEGIKDFWQKLKDKLIGDDDESLFKRSEEDDKEPKTELGKKLREHLDQILEKIKDAIDHGKTVKGELLEKVKEIREKLKELKVDLGEKAKELLKKIQEHARNWWKDLLDKLGIGGDASLFKRSEGDDKEPTTELGKKLREHLDEILQKIKDAIDQGKDVKADLVDKVKEIREKLKELKFDLGEKAKELLKKIQERFRNWLKDLLDKLGGGGDASLFKRSDEDEAGLRERLRKRLDDALEKLKEAFEKGKAITADQLEKLKEAFQGLKEKGISIGERAKELIKQLKEKAKDVIDKFLEKLGLKDSTDDKRSLRAQSLREKLREMRDAILNGLDVEALKEKVEELFGQFSMMARQMLEALKLENAREALLNLINKFLGKTDKRSIRELWEKVKNFFDELSIKIKEKYLKFGEWVKESLGNVLDKTKSEIENVKKIAKELKEKTKDLSKEIAAEALEWLQQYKEDLGNLYEDAVKSLKEVLQRKN